MPAVRLEPVDKLAIDGGTPVRTDPLPIFKLRLTDAERAAVLEVLESGFISRGPMRDRLAAAFCRYTGAGHALVCSSGTAALHLAVAALDLQPGDEVIVPSLSFVATAFAAEYSGLVPVFAEVDGRTLNLDPSDVATRITEKTRAIIPVHFAGQVADLGPLWNLAEKHDLAIVEDAAHAAGARHSEGMIGTPLRDGIRHSVCFSFFATKNMTSAEGGLVTTSDAGMFERMERLRAHGISPLEGAPKASGFYDVTMTGFNFHLSDVNIALGLEQLKRLDELNATRRHHAELLTELLAGVEGMRIPEIRSDHVFHLFNVLLDLDRLTVGRDDVVRALLAEGIGAGLYYRPIHLFTYFRDRYGTKDGMLPVTEGLGERIVTLPLYPLLSDADLEDVAAAIRKILGHYLR